MMNEWVFKTDTLVEYNKQLSAKEIEAFPTDVTSINWVQYFITFNYGMKKYYLKENVELPDLN